MYKQNEVENSRRSRSKLRGKTNPATVAKELTSPIVTSKQKLSQVKDKVLPPLKIRKTAKRAVSEAKEIPPTNDLGENNNVTIAPHKFVVERKVYGDGIEIDVDQEEDFLTDNEQTVEEAVDEEISDTEFVDDNNETGQLIPDQAHISDESSQRNVNFTITEENLLQIPGLSELVGNLVRKQVDKTLKGNLTLQSVQSQTLNESLDDEIQFKTPPQINSPAKQAMAQHKTLKSPSDTTIYAPALKLTSPTKDPQNAIFDKISNFVESVRQECGPHRNGTPGGGDQRRVLQCEQGIEDEMPHQASTSRAVDKELEETNQRTDRLIVEAEKFHAAIDKPKEGMMNEVVLSKQFGAGCGLSDDEFFHLTCHIDKSLQEKIERGDYVD